MKNLPPLLSLLAVVASVVVASQTMPQHAPVVLVSNVALSAVQRTALAEMRRFIVLLTGQAAETQNLKSAELERLLAVLKADGSDRDVVVLDCGEQRELATLLGVPPKDPKALTIGTLQLQSGLRVHLISATNASAVLAGAYALAHRWGLWFSPAGDTVPSSIRGRLQSLPALPLHNPAPAFSTRGLQPFHDFAEGPDWWTVQDYKHVINQIAKMQMNFIGLHTYPYSDSESTGTNEPTVWVGTKDQLDANGKITSAYPTSYANSLRNEWGNIPMNTSDFIFGANQVFSQDCYGSPAQQGQCPWPTTMEGNIAVFEQTAALLNDSFTWAHELAVKTCVGTETPLSTPPLPGQRLTPLNLYYSASRDDHFLTTTQCAECEGLYVFVRIEGYVYSQPCTGCIALSTYYNGQLEDNWLTINNPGDDYGFVRIEGYAPPSNGSSPGSNWTVLSTYYSAAEHDHYTVGTAAGRSDAQAHNYTEVVPSLSFAAVSGPALPTIQDYYEGIFTRIMSSYPIDLYWIWTPEGWEWNKMTSKDPAFTEAVDDLNAAMAAHDALNMPFEMATCGWVLGPLPDRTIFDKVLTTKYAAITSIDMDVGNTPVDPSYANVTRHAKWAIPWAEDDPGLTAPELWVNRTLEHMEDALKYGCEGLLSIHWRTKITSPQITAMSLKSWNMSLTSEDFWLSWSTAEFGQQAGPVVAQLFDAIDSFKTPRPVNWIGGPGGLQPDASQCGLDNTTYAFVTSFENSLKLTEDPADYDRLLYWVNAFRYMRSIARTECSWANYTTAYNRAAAGPDPATRQKLAQQLVIPARETLIANAQDMLSYLLPTITSRGEMGTIRNVLTHSLILAIQQETSKIEALLQAPLPPSAMPSMFYHGQPKLVVPVARSLISKDEPLAFECMLLANNTASASVSVYTRPAGSSGAFSVTSLSRVTSGRSVFGGHINLTADTEYYLNATGVTGAGTLLWPAGGPSNAFVVAVQ